MQVNLAGFNIDAQLVDLIRQVIEEYTPSSIDSDHLRELLESLAGEPLTPETLSAAYARISRSSKGIRELRRDSRASLNRARRSNEQIVFGFGHASIAEHAIFNLDITGATRLALEELESHRLASYTEKSQRYIAMSGDFLIPDEILAVGLKWDMKEVCKAQFETYKQLIKLLESFHSELPEQKRIGKAREDARYVLPLASRGQVGMTINARMGEQMVRAFKESNFSEVRLMGSQIHEELQRVVPSLIRYTEPNPAIRASNRELHQTAFSMVTSETDDERDDVMLISAPENGEQMVLASLLFRAGRGSFVKAKEAVEQLNSDEVKQIIIRSHSYINKHDSIRRELELGYFIFSITLSASAFAQLKRHRMASIIKQDYDIDLGVTIPPDVIAAGGEEIFQQAIERAQEMYNKLKQKLPEKEEKVAQYALTNGHRRRVLFQANARELTHFSRLREDKHAQWDIRNIAEKMIRLAQEACPGLMQFACGKDRFDTLKDKLDVN